MCAGSSEQLTQLGDRQVTFESAMKCLSICFKLRVNLQVNVANCNIMDPNGSQQQKI